jgi:Ca2+-dependent lipid-binding protein
MFSSSRSTVGLLTVSVVNAVGLDAVDKNGFSDPYVKLKIDDQQYKTKAVPKTVNPVWKQVCSPSRFH